MVTTSHATGLEKTLLLGITLKMIFISIAISCCLIKRLLSLSISVIQDNGNFDSLLSIELLS